MWALGLDDVAFGDAIAFFREKLSIGKEEWKKLTATAKAKAFTVAGVAQLDVIHDVWKAIDRAITDGTTLKDFRDETKASLTNAWGGTVSDPAWRIETIFRTNVQVAYSAGRYAAATDPQVLEDRPYWLYDAILDSRTSPFCKACDGVIRPAYDPWWKTHMPPAHHNCRSSIITLSQDQAEEMGIAPHGPKVTADQGFGNAPEEDAPQWEPSKSDYPKELWQEFEDKQP